MGDEAGTRGFFTMSFKQSQRRVRFTARLSLVSKVRTGVLEEGKNKWGPGFNPNKIEK